MALTAEQWYQKLRTHIPNWYWEDLDNQEAHARGVAAVFAALELDMEDMRDATYIANATAGILDDLGAERTVPRLTDELDAQYRERVRNIQNKSNCPALKTLIDAFLIVGESTIVEDWDSDLFLDREDAFLNRGDVLIDDIVNVFTVIVDQQLHDPYSFMDREYFLDRVDFVGTGESSQYVFDLIQRVISDNKAEGTNYRVIERVPVAS